jgi:hypothetical protein
LSRNDETRLREVVPALRRLAILFNAADKQINPKAGRGHNEMPAMDLLLAMFVASRR